MNEQSTSRQADREVVFDLVDHDGLNAKDIARLRRLFDAEYLRDFGPWDPDLPYGYAAHDVHVLARRGNVIVGHVGWGRRTISVGGDDVVVAGVGGVLVSASGRGQGLGARLLDSAVTSMKAAGAIEFGYLGCREEVVPFYAARGWTRISTAERSIDRDGQSVVNAPGPPLFIIAVDQPLAMWPGGDVDLRGRAW